MRILITGGSGFIGGYFMRAFVARGDEVTNLDIVPPAASLPAHRFIRGDTRDAQALDRALEGCDAVLHLAAAHHDFGITHETSYAVNETATELLCAAMSRAGIRELCFYSSVAVYGEGSTPPTEETSPTPTGAYGGSKLAGEVMVQRWVAQDEANRRALVIRPTVVFGRQNFANMYSLIRHATRRMFLSVGGGTNIKSLVHVDNLVAATLWLWSRPDAPAFRVINVVDKPDLTSRQIVDTIRVAAGLPKVRVYVPLWVGLMLALPFDVLSSLTGRNLAVSRARVRKLFMAETQYHAKALQATGFVAPVKLTDGIADMTRWYLEGGRHMNSVPHIPPADIVRAEGTASGSL